MVIKSIGVLSIANSAFILNYQQNICAFIKSRCVNLVRHCTQNLQCEGAHQPVLPRAAPFIAVLAPPVTKSFLLLIPFTASRDINFNVHFEELRNIMRCNVDIQRPGPRVSRHTN